MSFTEAIRTCLRNYVTFSGRARRPEYWWFMLFLFLGGLALGLVDTALFGSPAPVDRGLEDDGVRVSSGSGPLGSLFNLAMLLPSLAAGWRRMHDTGRSGLYLLYPLIVMVGIYGFAAFTGVIGAAGGFSGFGGIALVVLLLAFLVFLISPLLVLWWLTRPTQPGTNQWGPEPAR